MIGNKFSSSMRWPALFLLLVGMILAGPGCSCEEGGGGGSETGLIRCQNCDDVLEWIQASAAFEASRQIDMYQRGGGYYDDGDATGGDDFGDDDDNDAAGDDDDYTPPGDDDDSGAPEQGNGDDDDDHSDTNVQEQGVDEADIVKTDGDRLFLLSGGYLMLIDPIPADQTQEISRLEIEGRPQEMMIYQDVLAVFSYVYPHELPDDIFPGVNRSELPYEILKITVVDYSDPTGPSVLREVYVQGSYLSSRRIDASTRVVIYSQPHGFSFDGWIDESEYCEYLGYEWVCDEEAMQAAWEELLQEYLDEIFGTGLEDWIPKYHEVNYQSGQAVHTGGMLADCNYHYHPQAPRGYGFVTVMTILHDDPYTKQPDVAVIADRGIVYASSLALYLAEDEEMAMDWWEWDDLQQPSGEAWVHKFDIASNPAEAIYQASGAVEGHALNQFSLGEYQSNLRIATTTGWWDYASNHVFVLEQNGGDLDIIGSIRDIMPGEEIYAARFVADKGYLVTFMQTDPLFTLNLADPTDPKLVGELEIPGFSTYLHPMDEDHLLAIGEGGDQWGSTGGVALSIFDVSDFANPQRTHYFVIGENWSAYSDAQYNHKAFLYYEPKELLSIPITHYDWDDYYDDDDDYYGDDDDDDDDDSVESTSYEDENFAGFLVFHCTPEDGFELDFEAKHTDFEPELGSDTYWGMPIPRRSVVIGDYLYTLSDFALLVSDLEDGQDVRSIELPWQDPYGYGGYYYDDDDDVMPDEPDTEGEEEA
jgi:Beta propeller domain